MMQRMINQFEAEAMKRCNHCKAELSLSHFPNTAMKKFPDGKWPTCRKCHQEANAKWKKNNPDKVAAASARRRAANPQKFRDATRRHRAKLSLEERSARYRKWDLKTSYGITIADYEFLFSKQNGGCGICGLPCATGRRLAVDHNHETGKIRGLLCSACNLAVGKIEAIPNWTQKAAFYLAQHSEANNGVGSEAPHHGKEELRHLRS